MCGIGVWLRAYYGEGGELWNDIMKDLHRRGPDSIKQIELDELVMGGAVLHIQVK